MARHQSTPLRREMSRMFPKAKLERLAREIGVIQRQRRVEIVALLWVLLLTLDTRRKRCIADLRRAYAKATRTTLSASAFYGRLSESLARLLRSLVDEALGTAMDSARAGQAFLEQIREILCIDSTVIRLHDALAGRWPACRTNHTLAAAKLHLVLNVRGCGPQSVKITSERVHDGPQLRAGPWVRGRLLLFDLGYYRYQLFAAIQRQGGCFLTRLKEHANPEILRLHRTHRGRAIPMEGVRLQDIKDRLQRDVIDVEVEVDYRSRSYRGQRRGHALHLRLVGLRDTTRNTYHWYLTNLAPETVPAEEIGKLYGARWSIELLFREMKSCYQLESIPSRKRHVVEIFLYACVLTVLLSRALLQAVRRWGIPADRRTPTERWARLFISAAPELLEIILKPAPMARLERDLLRFFAKEAVDPNVHRPLLLQRAGLQAMSPTMP